MQSPFKKILLAMLLIALGVSLLLNLLNSKTQKPAEVLPPKLVQADSDSHAALPKFVPRQIQTETNSAADAMPEKISREKVEAWLAKHNRNAMSLLTAFRALNDTNLLNEAATNFPNDPHVELAVLSRDEFPAERRKWLDLFKQSSPSNSLANYFSAEDDFKNGNSAAAIQELQAASGKSQFENYATENLLDAEELYLDSNTDRRLATSYAMSDMSDENMPELATFKKIGIGIKDLQQQYVTAGDANSAVNLAQMGMTLANQLQNGDGGKYLINQMVGVAEENLMLSKLDQNTSYDFLNGQTPAQVLQQTKDQKVELRQLMTDFGPAQLQMMQSESETASYMQRMEIYGEVAAMKWLIQQHPPANPQP
jgi:hypothetical protein